MTDTEKNVVKAEKLIRDYCKGTGCMYCLFHRQYTAISKEGPIKRECCVLDNYPRNWPEEIKEEGSNE